MVFSAIFDGVSLGMIMPIADIILTGKKYANEIKEYFESLGVENILLRCVGNFENGQDIELSPSQNETLIQILKTKMHLPKEQIQAIIGKNEQKLPIPSKCWVLALQYTAGIDPDGETYLCSPWSQKKYSIGNVNDNNFIDFWGKEKHRRVVETLNNKMKNNECNPLLCRHYYSNLAIDAFLQGIIKSLPKTKLEEIYGRFI